MAGKRGTVRAILDALPNPAMLVGENRRILVANRAARSRFGSELPGRLVHAILRHPEALACIDAAFAEGGEMREVRIGLADGDIDMVFDLAACRIGGMPEGAGGIVISLTDVSELDETAQMRKDFIANVSHELRSPLTAVIGFLQTLKGQAWDDRESRRKFLEIMEQEADRMNRLVADLLSLSRVEANERVRPRQVADVPEILSSTVRSLEQLAARRGVALEIEEMDGELSVPGDRDQLRQVFRNLIENAVKYGREDGRVRIRCKLQAQCPGMDGAVASIAVADDGPGIAQIHVPRLTERFYRVDRHRSRSVGGTGLGLAIVKHIVNRHRGRLSIVSRQGKGSVFTVTLPLGADAQGEVPNDANLS